MIRWIKVVPGMSCPFEKGTRVVCMRRLHYSTPLHPDWDGFVGKIDVNYDRTSWFVENVDTTYFSNEITLMWEINDSKLEAVWNGETAPSSNDSVACPVKDFQTRLNVPNIRVCSDQYSNYFKVLQIGTGYSILDTPEKIQVAYEAAVCAYALGREDERNKHK